MAKRGSTRPYRLRFKWDSGITGCDTFATREQADTKEAEIRRYAELRDSTVEVTITDTRITN